MRRSCAGVFCSAARACAVLVVVAEGVLIIALVAIAAGAGVGRVSGLSAGRLRHDCFIVVGVRRSYAGVFCSAARACAVFVVVAEGVLIVALVAIAAGAGVGRVTLLGAGRCRYGSRIAVGVCCTAVVDRCSGERLIVRLDLYSVPLRSVAGIIHIRKARAIAECSITYCLNTRWQIHRGERCATGERRITYAADLINIDRLKARAALK